MSARPSETEVQPTTLNYASGPNDPEEIPGWRGTWRDWLGSLSTALLMVIVVMLLICATTIYYFLFNPDALIRP